MRSGNRVVSMVWGCGFLLEAGIRIPLALGLPGATFLLLWPVISYGMYAALLTWTISYTRSYTPR